MKFARSKAARHFLSLAALSFTAACSLGGGSDPVSDDERRVGAEQHPQLLAEFGGVYSGDEAAYVANLGAKVARAADLSGRCTFTLVNSDVVNAFAVPGCYIYVTRGLLAIVNSEAELAAVLAHEVGHIAADHSEEQQKRSIWRSLGVLAVGAITGSDGLARLAGGAAQFFTLRYSRKHEYEADDLGLEYMKTLGYDPYAAADMLQSLQRHEAYQARVRGKDEARSIPEWALTHPLTERRIERANEAAKDLGVERGELPENAAAYLRSVDGLLYGDDPEQGFVIGRRFAHPVMRIGFEAPQGFTLTNSPQAIMIEGPDGLRGEFAGGPLPNGDLGAYAEAVLGRTLGRAPFTPTGSAPAVTNAGPALVVTGTVQTNQGAVPISLAAYAAPDGGAYHFLMISGPGGAAPEAVAALFRSFRFLTPEEVAALKPRRIKVVRAETSLPAAALAQRSPAADTAAQVLMLNGLNADAVVRPGQMVKILEWSN